MSSQLDDMYRDIILDHFRAPRGKSKLDKKDFSSGGHNPSCGDEIEMDIKEENGVLKDIHVKCRGCAISVASGSILAEAVKGKPFEEVVKIAEEVRKILKGEEGVLSEDLEDVDALKGVRKFPVRVKCALLAWLTLIEGIKNYKSEDGKENPTISTDEDDK